MRKKITLKEKVYSEIFQDIIQGKYQVGDVISEIALAEKYKVSKAPIREALIELCNEQILQSIPRYGYKIVSITENDMKNVQDFRQILECNCLKRNWDCFTPDRIDMLEKIANFEPKNQNFEEVTKLWENNTEFHLTMVSFYGNKYIYDALSKSLNVLTRAFAQIYWDKWNNAVLGTENFEHRTLIEHLRKRDEDAAVECLYRDIIILHDGLKF